MNFCYLTQPPKKWTFEQPKLKTWVESWCKKGQTLNLFAGKTKLDINETRVDSNPEMIADYYMDALEYVEKCIEEGVLFDNVILDPPYNLRKSREKYEGKYIGSFTKIKNKLVQIVKKGGNVVTLGYDTVGMSKSRGFEKIAVCVVCHNGDHNDTLILVERKL